jgi:hypothetical protein
MRVIFAAFKEHQTAQQAIDRLTAAGIPHQDLSLVASASSPLVQDLLNETSEEETGQGALMGGAIGSLVGMLGGAAMFTIAGVGEALAAGLVSTTIGGAIGAYLGGIYSARTATEDELNVKEALMRGELLVIVTADGHDQTLVENTLRESGGEFVTIHDLETPHSEYSEAGEASGEEILRPKG